MSNLNTRELKERLKNLSIISEEEILELRDEVDFDIPSVSGATITFEFHNDDNYDGPSLDGEDMNDFPF